MRSRSAAVLVALLAGFLRAGAAMAQVDVWTHHNDIARSGANLDETQLSTSTVNVGTFGKLFSYAVDGDVYTQPLVINNVAIAGKGTHKVVYVATMNDSVYAFDADNNQGSNALPLWHVSFVDPANGITPVPAAEVAFSQNIRNPGPVGVMGTPVIDRATKTMYMVARTKESGAYVQRLHALDIQSGAEKFGGPVVIAASVSGTGQDNVGGQIIFNPKTQNQRPGLALANGNVYIAWASHDDAWPYHGWLMAYNASTLAQAGAFCVTRDGVLGGTWQGGQAPSIDAAGNVYIMTGNGTFDGSRNFGESIVKLNPNLSSVLDWFAPDNWLDLNNGDLDLGSAGVLLVPGTSLVIGGGKAGKLFVLNTGNMGHVQTGNGQIVQSFQATSGGHIHGAPVYWNGPNGPMIYVWGEDDYLKGFKFNGTTFNSTPVTQSTFVAPYGMPGGFQSVTANGSAPGSGILWSSLPYVGNAETGIVSGILRAFDASDLTHEIWNSRMNVARDDLGSYAKYVPPTVANGRVYLASFSNYLHVYGLLSSITPPTGGLLTLTGVASASAVDLTGTGASDWAHWPGYDHKAGGAAQISDAVQLGSGANTFTGDPRTLTWSDGTPTVTGSSSAGLFISGNGNGFLITAPADTTTRTLTLYVGGWNSKGALNAHLSDGSATDGFDSAFSAGSQYDVVYTLTYHAASANQTIAVQWTQFTGDGNVTLQGAALSGGGGAPPPPAAPTGVSASDGTSSSSVAVSWNASTGATSYTVYRSTSAGVQGSSIGISNTTSLTDATVTPGTVYYYGVTASGAGGTSALSAQNSGFASVPVSPPAAPTGVSASDGTSSSSVAVSWNASTGATSYTVYRSTSAGVQGSSLGSVTATGFTDATVTPGTVYYYGVTASSAGGTSVLSAQDSGYATAGAPGSGALTGAVVTSAAAVNLTTMGTADWAHWPGYDHKASGGGQIANVTPIGTGVASYGNDPRSLNWTDGTPTGSATTGGGIYISGAGKGFAVTVPADTTQRTLTMYVGGWSSSGKLTAHLSDGSAADYVDATLTGGGQYDGVYTLSYKAGAPGQTLTVQWVEVAGYGNVTLQGAALGGGGGVPPPPAAPTGVSASDGTSSSSVAVSWNASTGATSYTVYRSTSAGVQGSSLGSVTATSFTDATVTPGTVYYYGVTASGAGGTSALSAQNSGFASVPVSPPAAPTGVSASDGTSSSSVAVSWNASTGATSYTVYRSTSAGVQGSSLGSVTATSFTDATVTPGTVYYYGVTASGAGGTSALSAQNSGFASVPVSPPAAPTGVSASDGTSSSSVAVSWNASTGATSYTVYRSTSAGVQGSSIGISNTTSLTDATVTPGTVYYYGVTASGAGGTSALSAQNSGFASVPVSPPAAPTGVSASDGTSSSSVAVSWNASTGATSYTVYRSTSAGVQGSSLGSVTATGFTDATVTPGTVYYYGVTASSAGGTSVLSAQDSGYATAGAPGSGALTGAVVTSAAAVNLTTMGTADWAHWPGYDHKASGGGQIANVTPIGTGVASYGNDPRSLNWTDGTPTGSATTGGGIYISGAGKGFAVTVPADTTQRTLTMYVGGWSSSGKLTAHLSDGSAADYVDATLTGGGQYDGVYTLSYKAGAPGQTLTVQWVEVAGYGNVTLQGAALGVNVALAANGSVASASSINGPGYPPGAVIDNQRSGANWGNGGGWNDATPDVFPDWVQINFNGMKTINRAVVYSVQDNYLAPVEPTSTMTFSLYGVTDFQVQGFDGTNWITLATVAGNNLVIRSVTFTPYTTDRIRIYVTNALTHWTRFTEVEAWSK